MHFDTCCTPLEGSVRVALLLGANSRPARTGLFGIDIVIHGTLPAGCLLSMNYIRQAFYQYRPETRQSHMLTRRNQYKSEHGVRSNMARIGL